MAMVGTRSASGRRLCLAVIFKGKSLRTSQFLPSSLCDWLDTTSENDMTSDSVGLTRLRQNIMPESVPAHADHWLLILDRSWFKNRRSLKQTDNISSARAAEANKSYLQTCLLAQ